MTTCLLGAKRQEIKDKKDKEQEGTLCRLYTVEAGAEGGLLWHAWKPTEYPSEKSKGYLFIIWYSD